MKLIKFLIGVLFFTSSAFCQSNKDSLVIRKIFDEALSNGQSHKNLEHLCNKIGARLSGSQQAEQAVQWARNTIKATGVDTVFLQEVMVPHWVRGGKEEAKIISKSLDKNVPVTALGGSIGTGEKGISAEVIEVKSFEELEKLGRKNVEGKIVFFNRPMDPTKIRTFQAYGGAVRQRGLGAVEAAKYGGIAAIVRSMTPLKDDNPHTGAMHYKDSVAKVPAAAISTNAADLLSVELKKDPHLKFFLKQTCETLPDVKSYNVVGEIKGTEHPDEFIVVGGHLDSWDIGTGAHDDGAGCVQSIEVLRLFKTLGIKPKRTIRAVMFMNEENGLRGGKKYAEIVEKKKEKHIAAIESDAGGFSPRGFSMTTTEEKFQKVKSWKPLFEPYGVYNFTQGGGGADISPLEPMGVPVMELEPDSQRYFDYHHACTDTFEAINKRELELGGAAMAALIYLMSEYGL